MTSYEDQLQEIARSSYADMLLDDERNRAYYLAIRISVKALVTSVEHNPNRNRFFHCCDIGTGSGLLSMMIVSSFQELKYEKFHVTAFESFKPMAKCAEKIIAANGNSDFITVVHSRSEMMQEASFDLLVAELLDTELIGEGCLSIYRHAVQYLCSPTCLFVPHKARIFVQPVASSFLFKRHAIDDIRYKQSGEDGKIVQVLIADEIKSCCGLADMDDIQASALRDEVDFYKFCKPEVAFEITFNSMESLKDEDYTELLFLVERDVKQPPVVVVWWDIVMYDRILTNNKGPGDDIGASIEVLSCAPKWARSESMIKRDKEIQEMYGREVWREHWIQAVYYFNEVLETRDLATKLKQGDIFKVHAFHDSRSMWFSLNLFDGLPPNCKCGVHRSLSRTQLAFLNDLKMMQPLLDSALHTAKLLTPSIDGRITFSTRPPLEASIPIQAAPKWNITFPLSRRNRPETLEDLSLSDEIAWEKVMVRFNNHISISPVQQFSIKFAQVRFNNLNRIATKIKQCEGFNMEELDEMIGSSSDAVDKKVQSYSLWEFETYRCEFNNYTVFSSTWDSPETRRKLQEGTYWRNFKLPVAQGYGDWKKGWALAFWAEFTLKDTGQVISTGDLSNSLDRSKPMEWNRSCKQIVYFMHDHPTPPFSNVTVDIEVGLDDCYPQVQRSIDYNTKPSSQTPTKLKEVI